MKTFKQYITTIKLSTILDGDLPEENEVLYNFITPEDMDKSFHIKTINPNLLLTYKGDMTIKNSFKFADNDSKKLIQYYIKKQDSKPIILDGIKVIDGNHRVMAAILSKRLISAIDLKESI
jgi:hypothetical protein